MGFGYLLIGYIAAFAFSFSQAAIFFDIIGGAVMLVGLSKLALHGKNFFRAMCLDLAYILLCLGRTALFMLGIMKEGGILYYAFGIGIAIVSLLLQFFLLAAIYYIAEMVELDEEMGKARRNIKFTLLYYFAYVASFAAVPLLGPFYSNIISRVVIVFGFVVLFLNAVLIHSCYCRICLKGQESGERPPSRFAWVNKLNDKADALFDSAYLRKKKEKNKEAPEEEELEPGYRRVKRKKNSKRKK